MLYQPYLRAGLGKTGQYFPCRNRIHLMQILIDQFYRLDLKLFDGALYTPLSAG